MSQISFNDEYLVNLLIEFIPEFKEEIISEFSFSSYIIYGDFGIFLADKILNSKSEIDLIQKCFDFLNNLIENGDEKTIQMLRVTTLEILVDRTETIEAAKIYFTLKSLEIFSEVIFFVTGKSF